MGKDAKQRRKKANGASSGRAATVARAPKPGKAKAGKAKAEKARGAAPLPVPASLPASPARPPKKTRRAEARHLAPLAPPVPPQGAARAAILDALWHTVEARRAEGDLANSHSARLLARGTAKVAQKLGEEAVECVIEATQGHRAATVLESADLLYHLVVVWVDAGIRPDEVWAELARRQGISGIAEKAARPQGIMRAAGTTKLP